MQIVEVSRDQKDLLVPINIEAVEKKKNAKFICETCIRTSNGNWSDEPVQLYWQEAPPVKGYSNYFAIFVRRDLMDGTPRVFITSGESAVKDPISAIRHNGEIGYSRCRHDFRWVGGQEVAIDGGRDYTKIVGRPQEYLTLEIKGPHLVIKEESPDDVFLLRDIPFSNG